MEMYQDSPEFCSHKVKWFELEWLCVYRVTRWEKKMNPVLVCHHSVVPLPCSYHPSLSYCSWRHGLEKTTKEKVKQTNKQKRCNKLKGAVTNMCLSVAIWNIFKLWGKHSDIFWTLYELLAQGSSQFHYYTALRSFPLHNFIVNMSLLAVAEIKVSTTQKSVKCPIFWQVV